MAAHKALTLASQAAGYRHGHGYGELGDIGKSLNDSSFRLFGFRGSNRACDRGRRKRVACNRDVEDCVLAVAIHQLAGNRTRSDEFENEIEVFG